MTSDIEPAEIESASATLEVDGHQKFHVSLYRDRTINCSGTFQIDETGVYSFTEEKTFNIGRSEEILLEKLLEQIDPNLGQYLGRSGKDAEMKGLSCRVAIQFSKRDGDPIGCEALWGTESSSPPNEIVKFLALISGVAESWLLSARRRNRPWWKFW